MNNDDDSVEISDEWAMGLGPGGDHTPPARVHILLQSTGMCRMMTMKMGVNERYTFILELPSLTFFFLILYNSLLKSQRWKGGNGYWESLSSLRDV